VASAATSSGAELFADFVGAVLNDLVYLLKDSLGVRGGVGQGGLGGTAVDCCREGRGGAVGKVGG
jgi:hypothetical protein